MATMPLCMHDARLHLKARTASSCTRTRTNTHASSPASKLPQDHAPPHLQPHTQTAFHMSSTPAPYHHHLTGAPARPPTRRQPHARSLVRTLARSPAPLVLQQLPLRRRQRPAHMHIGRLQPAGFRQVLHCGLQPAAAAGLVLCSRAAVQRLDAVRVVPQRVAAAQRTSGAAGKGPAVSLVGQARHQRTARGGEGQVAGWDGWGRQVNGVRRRSQQGSRRNVIQWGTERTSLVLPRHAAVPRVGSALALPQVVARQQMQLCRPCVAAASRRMLALHCTALRTWPQALHPGGVPAAAGTRPRCRSRRPAADSPAAAQGTHNAMRRP